MTGMYTIMYGSIGGYPFTYMNSVCCDVFGTYAREGDVVGWDESVDNNLSMLTVF